MTVNTGGTGATFRERMNWVSIASLLGIYGVLLVLIVEAPTDALRTALLFAVAIGVQTMVAIGAAIVIALTSSEEPDDERVRAIVRRSARYSSPLMTVLVVAAIFAIIGQQVAAGVGATPRGLLGEPLMVAHLLLFGLVVSELLRGLTLAYDYRRA